MAKVNRDFGDKYMNQIDVKCIKTRYDYFEDYWMIDGVPIVAYLDQHKSASLSVFGSSLGLLPAWSGKLILYAKRAKH